MNRRERKKEETRTNIISCAISLFREKGFAETSMEEIAEKADVAKGTLYNYFEDKESILVGYFQAFVAKHGQELTNSIKDIFNIEERLHKFLDFISKILAAEKELAPIYMKFRMQTFFDNDPFDNPRRSGLETILQEIIRDAQEREEIRRDIPAIVLARNFQFQIRSYLAANIFSKEPADLNVLKDQLTSLFLNGAKA